MPAYLLPLNLPVAGLLSAFWLSNLAGRAIVIVLFVGSMLVWSLMMTKYGEIRAAERTSVRFLAAYRKEKRPLALYLKRQKFEGSPLYEVYEKACRALGSVLEIRGTDPNDLFLGGTGAEIRLSEPQLNHVRTAVDRAVSDQALLLESGMGVLAQAVTVAPLLGLLGTVWGVMESFETVVRGGSAMLTSVAPGVAGALLTTVVGLLVALPSSIGYNLLSDRIRRLAVEMDNFSQELINQFERQQSPAK